MYADGTPSLRWQGTSCFADREPVDMMTGMFGGYRGCTLLAHLHSLIMAHRVQVFSHELNAINNVKWDKQTQSYNRWGRNGTRSLYLRLPTQCVGGKYSCKQQRKEKTWKTGRLIEEIGKEEDFRPEKKAPYTRRRISRCPHPYTCRFSRKIVYWIIMDEMKKLLMMDSITY